MYKLLQYSNKLTVFALEKLKQNINASEICLSVRTFLAKRSEGQSNNNPNDK